MISSLPIKEEKKPSAIKVVITSGDLADEALLYKAKEALRPMKVVPSWGMSECAPLMGYRNDEPAPRYRSGLAGVGRALQGTCVKIAENGTETAARKGEHGDLHVTSQALIRSYLRNAKPEDFYDDPEGKRWFKTGDVAVMEDDGVVFVVGRTKDVIKCKGFGIVPSIMERCLDDFFKVEVSLSSNP
jgi:acyl-CoA synthetase (AMP-forming)/AMP-acid ligase II